MTDTIVNTRNKETFANNLDPLEVSEVPLTGGI